MKGKSEITISKSQTIPNALNQNVPKRYLLGCKFGTFENWNFNIV
jgi:hypothetical protein